MGTKVLESLGLLEAGAHSSVGGEFLCGMVCIWRFQGSPSTEVLSCLKGNKNENADKQTDD